MNVCSSDTSFRFFRGARGRCRPETSQIGSEPRFVVSAMSPLGVAVSAVCFAKSAAVLTGRNGRYLRMAKVTSMWSGSVSSTAAPTPTHQSMATHLRSCRKPRRFLVLPGFMIGPSRLCRCMFELTRWCRRVGFRVGYQKRGGSAYCATRKGRAALDHT